MLCSSNRCLFWSQISPTASPNDCRGTSPRFFNSEANMSVYRNEWENFYKADFLKQPLSSFLCTRLKHRKDDSRLTGICGAALCRHSTPNGPSGRLSNHSFVGTPSLSPPHPTHLVQQRGSSSNIYTQTHTLVLLHQRQGGVVIGGLAVLGGFRSRCHCGLDEEQSVSAAAAANSWLLLTPDLLQVCTWKWLLFQPSLVRAFLSSL